MLEQKLDSLGTSMEDLGHLIDNMPFEKLISAIEALTAQLAAAPLPEQAPAPVAVVIEKPVKKKAVKEKPVEDAPVEADTPAQMSVEEMTRLALGMSREGKGDIVRAKLAEIGVTRIPLLEGAQLGIFETFIKEVTA
jgi:hypothetical protein